MPRVKRGTTHVKKRRKLYQDAKGYKWGRKKLIRLAKTAVTKAGVHAYTHRKQKKREARGLWQIKINAFVRIYGLSYSVFMSKLKKEGVELDRKVLADLATNNPEIMEGLLKEIGGFPSAEEVTRSSEDPKETTSQEEEQKVNS
jgi:large subunit ribosomal protein L20